MNNNTTEVVLSINGEQAKAKLKELEESAKQLKAQLDKTADPKAAKKLEKNIESINKRMQTIESHTKTVERTLRNLDKASPKQLNETLGILRTNLNNIERGSKAWDKQIAAIRRVQLEIEKVNGELRASQKMSGGGFAAMGKSMLTMFFNPTTLAMGAVAGLTRAIRGGIEQITDFEQANANLAAVLGTTRAGILDLTTDAKRLGATTMFTASEVTQLQTELAKLGFSKNEILSSTEAVLKLSAATGAGLGEAAALAGASMRAFNLDATEMERVTSVLAVSTTKSALSFEKLATALPIVSPVAKQFGFTIEDTVTLLGKLSDAGFDASSAATATRNIFLNLANESGKLAKALGRPIKSIEDLGPALVELRNKGVNLAEMLELTDKRSVAAFATFVSGADDLKSLKDSITDCSEALDDMVNEQMNTLHGSTLILKSAWEGLMLSFSNSTGPLKKATDALAKLIQKWTEARTIAQGGEGAVSLFRKGANEDVAMQYIQGFYKAGFDKGKIQVQAQQDINAIQKEREELAELYKQYGEIRSEQKGEIAKGVARGALSTIAPVASSALGIVNSATSDTTPRATRKEVENKLKALGVETDMEAIAKRLADLDDQLATKQMVVDMLEEKTNPEDANESKSANTISADDYRAQEQAKQNIAYAQGLTANEEYKREMLAIDVEYYRRKMEEEKKGTTEYLKAYSDYTQAKAKLKEYDTKQQEKLDKEALKKRLAEENLAYEENLISLQQSYVDGNLSNRAYQTAMEEAELDHLRKIKMLYEEGSKEQLKAEENYQKKSLQIQQRRFKEQEQMRNSILQSYMSDIKVTNTDDYDFEKQALESLRTELMQLASTEEEKLAIEYSYQEARYQIAKKYNDKTTMEAINAGKAACDEVIEYLNSDAGKALTGSFQTLVSGMGQIFSGLTDLIDAETDLQTAQITKRYDAEIKAAEGNEKEVARLEQEKQDEIAKVKNEASEKQYAMQVIQTIAQTAIAALNAYSSAAAIPMVGWIMAPLAASMAVVAGGLQLAALKKQQEAAAAQGYAEGGYTKPGKKYEPAGIVHAGEWVASQETLANPVAAATIATIDEAQRTNTLGNLSPADVSGSITANQRIARATDGVNFAPSIAAQAATNMATSKTLEKLNKRLNEPFVTVNTVTGDKGIRSAQRNYDKLMKNKSK